MVSGFIEAERQGGKDRETSGSLLLTFLIVDSLFSLC